MTVPPARILGVQAMAGPVEPWVPEGISLRILMNPRLGIPLGPFAVGVHGVGEEEMPRVDVSGSGPGWRGGEIDGVAWLRLLQPPDERRPPIIVRLDGGFEPGTRISVVRYPNDLGEGISSRHEEPYILSAPDVRYLRVEGRCFIEAASVARAEPWLIGDIHVPLGLPLGVIGPLVQRRLYAGRDPDGTIALERVRAGAPLMHGPHELPTPASELADRDLAREAEVARVTQLVLDGGRDVPLADQLDALIHIPHARRHLRTEVQDLIEDSPQPTRGTMGALEAILAASGEPGIARWLGFATALPLPAEPVVAVTVAGRWFMPNDRWTRWAQRFDDRENVETAFVRADLEDQLVGGFLGGETIGAFLWTQARVHVGVPPDPPNPPQIRGEPPGTWMIRGSSDVVRLPLAFGGIVPLAQAGVVRLGPGDPVPIQPEVAGLPERTRALLIADGSGVDVAIADPEDDGRYAFRGWQADMFGRWSEPSLDLDIAGPPRPALPTPEARWFRDPDEALPTGDAPFVPRIKVRVGVPVRTAGQPEITAVSAGLDGASVQQPPTIPMVEFSLAGDPLARAATGTQQLAVSFSGSDGSTASAAPIEIEFVDPRPPIPPPRPPVLLFADPPDASGTAAYRVPLPSGAGIEGWRVFVTSESRLLRSAQADGLNPPPATMSRNDRAQAWIDQSASLKRERFDCATPTPVTGPAPFRAFLPGALAEVVLVRPVPQRKGGVEPAFATCPVLAFAVPFAVAPAAPDVTLDRTAEPPVIRIGPRPGAVGASRFRLRLATSLLGDPRAAVIVSEGELVAGAATVPVPVTLPFASAYAIAEVLAAPEAGQDPRPTLWTAPSAPVQLLQVPAVPTELTGTPTAIVDGQTLRVTVPVSGLPGTPAPRPFRARLFQRDAAASPWELVAEADVTAGSALIEVPVQPGASFQVALVDPLGRASTPVPVAAP